MFIRHYFDKNTEKMQIILLTFPVIAINVSELGPWANCTLQKRCTLLQILLLVPVFVTRKCAYFSYYFAYLTFPILL